MEINGRPLAIIAEALAGTNIDNCPHVCVTRPCGTLATCVPTLENYECVCNPTNAQCNQAEEVPSIQINVAQQRQQLELKRNITERWQRLAASTTIVTSAASAAASTPTPSTTLPTGDADLLRTHIIKTASEIIVASSSDSVTIIDHLRVGRREDAEELARRQASTDEQSVTTQNVDQRDDVDDDEEYQADEANGAVDIDDNDDYEDDYYYDDEDDDDNIDEDYNSKDAQKTTETRFISAKVTTTPKTTTAATTPKPPTTTTTTTTTPTTTMQPASTTTTLSSSSKSSEFLVVEHPQYRPNRIRGRYLSVDNDRLIQMDQNLRLRKPYTPYAVLVHAKKDYGRKSKKAQHISGKSFKSRAGEPALPLLQQEDLQTTKELLDDMERIMKNGNDYRAREAAAAAAALTSTSLGSKHRGAAKGGPMMRRSRGACFTGADSYFHYNDAETMRQIISYQIDLNLRFKTHSVNGLLLWTGRHSALEVDDYLSLGIENG